MKKLLLFLVTMMLPMVASANAVEIDGIYYNLVSKVKAAEVTSNPNKYSGEIVIPESVEYGGMTYSVTSIGNEAFEDCSGLTSVIIPNSVTTIGNDAFNWCISLTSVIIPNSVTSIGNEAFSNCRGLTSVIIGNNVNSFGYRAFYRCSGLTSVTIPNSVTTIGNDAFEDCSGLTSVTIPNSVTTIGEYAFYRCNNLTSLTIPNSVTTIGNSAFRYCTSLTSLTIPGSVTSIGAFAFQSCSGLASVTIPNSVTSINEHVFEDCISLTSVTIPNSVTSIGNSAFHNCNDLTSVTIGTGIYSIYREAFSNCYELTDVFCYAENVPNTNSDAFQDSYINDATLHVPVASINHYKSTSPWSGFGTIMGTDGSAPVTQKCATPTINYVNGKLSFSCETEDVEFVSEIKCADINKFYSKDVSLTGKYTVTVYATKTGYDNSDTVTEEIDISGGASSGVPGDVNGDGIVNTADIVAIANIIMGAE